MKKLTKIVSSVLMVGVLVATGITAFASDTETDDNTNSSNTAISQECTNRRSMKRGKGGFGNMERPELTEEQKVEMAEHMKERLAEALKDGNITQEQYDQAISDIAEGKRPMHLGRGRNSGKGISQRGLCNLETPEQIDDQK